MIAGEDMRHPTPAPPEALDTVDGLAYALFLPEGEPRGSVVVVHGAGSRKENHFDFCRAARAAGFAALTYDQRGHGDSSGPLDERVLDDVETVRGVLPDGPLALRGSSMGGYVSLLAARPLGASAVIAICPAGAEHLIRGLRSGDWEWHADVPSLERFLES